MTLKRSRGEITSSQRNNNMTKKVHFCASIEVHVGSLPSAIPEEDEEQPHYPSPSSSLLWYTRHEQRQQLQESLQSIPAWRANGFAVLLEDSYQQPHSKVQEYLHAFCAQQQVIATGDAADGAAGSVDITLRGLELSLNASHAQERHCARRMHRQTVLLEQQHPSNKDNSSWDDRLAQCSRSSSAPSKFFAMRMGRADARVVVDDEAECGRHVGDCGLAAQEIAEEHQQRQHEHSATTKKKKQQQRQQKRRSPNNKNPLASLICLRATATLRRVMMALPIQSVVYGRFRVQQRLLTR